MAVHPHTRGENGCSAHICAHRNRYIPTRVGKTPPVIVSQIIVTVHPHTRGENTSITSFKNASTGTSPHAWGKRNAKECGLYHCRYIPTRVGKTHGFFVGHLRHLGTSPHAWGKLAVICLSIAFSSVHPHTRGENGDQSLDGFALRWYIPTRVGKTTIPIISIANNAGTSPHAWGKRVPTLLTVS